MTHKTISRTIHNGAAMRNATTDDRELLVSRMFLRDKVDEGFRNIVRKARRALKKAPGGRRAWIFYQATFGAYNPHRPILEMIDALVEGGAPEGDTEEIALFFLRYIQTRYAVKHAKEMSVNEALKLKLCADAASVEPGVDVLLHPGPGTLEVIEERVRTEMRAEEQLLEVVTIARGIQA